MRVVLDNGHGGVINGNYQTPGKRSPKWKPYGVLYEGTFNRWIVNGVKKELDYKKIPYFHVSPEDKDISLTQRVMRTNLIHAKNKDVYLVSVHANAGKGTGWEVFTSPGETKSDEIATKFIEGFEGYMPIKPRFDMSDGDKDKEAKFKILMKTTCPAILIECGFMDNPKDYQLLWDKDFQNMIINRMVYSIESLF